MTGGAKRGLLYLVVIGLLLDGGEFYLFARSVSTLADQQHAQCRFYDDLGSAPVTEVNGKASLLGVEIVSDARVSWHHLGCPGVQQPPDPLFLKWAKHYNLPAN